MTLSLPGLRPPPTPHRPMGEATLSSGRPVLLTGRSGSRHGSSEQKVRRVQEASWPGGERERERERRRRERERKRKEAPARRRGQAGHPNGGRPCPGPGALPAPNRPGSPYLSSGDPRLCRPVSPSVDPFAPGSPYLWPSDRPRRGFVPLAVVQASVAATPSDDPSDPTRTGEMPN